MQRQLHKPPLWNLKEEEIRYHSALMHPGEDLELSTQFSFWRLDIQEGQGCLWLNDLATVHNDSTETKIKHLWRHGNPLQYSCLENPMDRGAWWARVHGVVKSRTRLKQLSTHAHKGKWAVFPLSTTDWISLFTFTSSQNLWIIPSQYKKTENDA